MEIIDRGQFMIFITTLWKVRRSSIVRSAETSVYPEVRLSKWRREGVFQFSSLLCVLWTLAETLLVSMKWREDKLTKKSQARMSGLWKRLRLVLKKFLLLFFLKVCGICSLEAAKKRSLQYDLRLLHFFAWIIDHDFRTRVFGWVNCFREYRV